MTHPSEMFSLEWKDFTKNLVSCYHDLRVEPDFSDVTLVCEEDQQIEAHRIILTACSPFFNTVLKRNLSSHPMIYMRGIRTKDMVAVVDFIYHGQTNVSQEDLDGFLALAGELQLKGLAESPENISEAVENTLNKPKKLQPQIRSALKREHNHQPVQDIETPIHTNDSNSLVDAGNTLFAVGASLATTGELDRTKNNRRNKKKKGWVLVFLISGVGYLEN